MAKKISAKRFTANIIVSIIAQIISLSVSFILNLIVPKFIDQIQYAYWQYYVLYMGYVGVLHFGLLDGIVLRYSQYDYDEIDKARLRSQFVILLVFTSIITILVSLVSLIALKAPIEIVVILVSASIITKNLITYTSYTFQITNRINKYALLIIFQRVVFGLFVVILLVCRVNDFYWFCIADLTGDLFGIVIASFFNKGMYFGKTIGIKESFKEAKLNIASGIILMLANWSAILLTSGAKMIIQWRWDEITFAKVSFAFSITNLFLSIVTALSVVLFPSLKRIDEDKLTVMYKNIRGMMTPLMLFILIVYFPGCLILNKWLPAYEGSLPYLGMLLPLIIYSSKITLLTNNYLKVYRKEKYMLLINLFTAIFGILLFVLCAYVFNSLEFVLISVVLTILLNSVLSEIVICKITKINLIKSFIVEAVMVIGFILIVYYMDLIYGCLAYLELILIYSLICYNDIANLFSSISSKIKSKIDTKNNNDINNNAN